VLGVDDGVGIALQVKAGIACIDEHAAQVNEVALDGEDTVENFGGRRVEDLVLKLIDVR
jgi:hypothetical protein